MKRAPEDYTLRDVEEYIAKIHGMTLNQIMALEFPPPDCLDNDEPVWRFETVYSWLDVFHTALHVSEAAANPEGFEKFVSTLRELMQAREQKQGQPGTLDRYSACNFANLVGYTCMWAFEADRKKGIIPPPDGVIDGSPYWRRETIERFKGGAR